MSIVIDILLLAIFGFNVYNGYKKGFVKTLFGLFGVIIALWGSSAIAPMLGEYINDEFVQPALEEIICTKLSDSAQDGDVLVMENAISNYSMSATHSKEMLDLYVNKGDSAINEISLNLSEGITRPTCKAVAFLLLFIVIYFAVRILSFVLDKFFRLPVLNFANSWLGLATGVLCGLLIVTVLACTFEGALPWLSRRFPQMFSGSLIDNTIVLKLLCEYNLFATLVNGVAGIVS